ncbi:MAG: hypothetical protein KAI73_03630, partial [Rhodospirillaceae bacterium]|nr:hypothetical protein [Rhodospirillaceae bacterium]
RFFKRTGSLKFRVGILGGARQRSSGPLASTTKTAPGGETFHWRHREFGTEHTAASPFFVKGLTENTGRATNEFVAQYGKAIDRALKRAAKVRVNVSSNI